MPPPDNSPSSAEAADRARIGAGSAPADSLVAAPKSPFRGDLAIRLLLPAAAALTLVSVLTGSDSAVAHDLHLIAPDGARPGQSIAVRAYLYGDLHRIEGARLKAVPATIELQTPSGALLARAAMKSSHAGTMEGALTIPAKAQGAHLLILTAVDAGRSIAVERPMVIGPEVHGLAPHGRPLRSLQQQSQGPVIMRGGLPAPEPLRLRVEGGVCVPTEHCRLHVHVGDPSALIAVPGNAAFQVVGDLAATDPVSITGVVHGPEASVRVSVLDQERTEVGHRSFRLPVGLATATLSLDDSIAKSSRPAMRLSGEPGSCIVDAFREGLWVRTAAVDDCGRLQKLPYDLSPGLWRLQVRRDAFSADTAAVRAVYIRRDDESLIDIALAVAARVNAIDGQDLLSARRLHDPRATIAVTREELEYLLASLESGLIPLPTAASSLPAALSALAAQRSRVRILAVLVVALCGIAIALLVARRGLSASEQARDIMAQAGSSEAHSSRNRLRMTLSVLAAVCSLALAFAAIALYLIARGWGP